MWDETSAPVAALRPSAGGYDLVETGAAAVARVATADVDRKEWVDDQWWLTAGPAALPLRPLAAVALVPAAKVLPGHPWPVPSRPTDEEREGWQPFD